MWQSSSDFKLVSSRNLVISAGKERFLFDPTVIKKHWRSQNTIACISHAHTDHVAAFESSLQKIVTPPTLDIYRALGGKPRKFHPIVLGKEFPLTDGGSIQVHPAGHMLGAAQFVLEKNGARLVYTGDFNLISSLTVIGANPIQCDVLLMEATYGRPDAVFPPRERVYAEIADWTSYELTKGKIPAFQVYARGKAQEIIQILNTYLTAPVVVDSTIAKVSEIYRKYDIPLEFINEHSEEGREVMRQGGYVYISSKILRSPKSTFKHQYVRAAATGWAQLYPLKKVDRAFPLSAHADFQQLVQYVQAAKPRAVFLTCGDTVTFGAVLEKLNVKQIEPQRRRQLDLMDFI
ncbi:MAG: MBL fold metallo-hydrolase [Candidatus Odinarchaeota archaeon]